MDSGDPHWTVMKSFQPTVKQQQQKSVYDQTQNLPIEEKVLHLYIVIGEIEELEREPKVNKKTVYSYNFSIAKRKKHTKNV
jgi:hypothetical protein